MSRSQHWTEGDHEFVSLSEEEEARLRHTRPPYPPPTQPLPSPPSQRSQTSRAIGSHDTSDIQREIDRLNNRVLQIAEQLSVLKRSEEGGHQLTPAELRRKKDLQRENREALRELAQARNQRPALDWHPGQLPGNDSQLNSFHRAFGGRNIAWDNALPTPTRAQPPEGSQGVIYPPRVALEVRALLLALIPVSLGPHAQPSGFFDLTLGKSFDRQADHSLRQGSYV
ncbi:hypothetical protein OIV83_003803 [Microbotryomycetes sp. JL201]|nr:hypothetical protein OIV83_003803 [Microbotryomycetes sp. JL201]